MSQNLPTFKKNTTPVFEKKTTGMGYVKTPFFSNPAKKLNRSHDKNYAKITFLTIPVIIRQSLYVAFKKGMWYDIFFFLVFI